MRRPKAVDVLFWLCAALTAAVVNTCAQIEYHNWRSGNYLDVKTTQEPGVTWHTAATGERVKNMFVQRMRLTRGATEEDLKAPPSVEELNSFETWRQRALRENRLHWWVSTFGVLQYLLAPLAVIWAAFLALKSRKHRVPSIVFAGLALMCIVMMLHRQYFQSLGW
jgi:hypothetical protein